MNYFKDFDSFVFPKGSSMINEGLMDNGKIIKKAFIKNGPRIVNGEIVDPKEVIDTVEDAIQNLSFDFGSFFNFVKDFTIIYFWYDKRCNTMAVDEHMNIYISVPFVKFKLKMNKRLIGAVIMHEILHVAFNHLSRGKSWLVSQNKPFNDETHHDNNLAADIEVNTALIKKHIITAEELIKDIEGLYLKEVSANVPPMEMILEDGELMEKLRKMCPLEENDDTRGNGEYETTSEFDEGYIDMKNKITDLVNKYGPEKALEKLREIGAIDGVNPYPVDDFNFDDIFSLNFLTLKHFDEFINESKEAGSEGFRTKMDGYREAVRQAVKEIASALSNDDGMTDDNMDGGAPNGPIVKNNIEKSKLKPMNLPGKNKGKGKKGEGLPSNINQSGSENKGDESQNNEKSENDNPQSGKGGSGKDSQDGDNKLRNNIEQNGLSNDIDISYNSNKKNGTGTYIESNSNIAKSFTDTLRKDYGGDFEKIREIVKNNIENNTEEKIASRKQDVFSRLPQNDYLKQIWEKGKESESKYKAMWKKILKDFLLKKTRRAGVDVEDKNTKWYDTRRMTVGQITPKNLKKAQDMQDINVYVDVSGSVYSNMELMKLIAQSLVAFLVEYKYSGINVIPWASTSTGIHRVDEISKIGKEKAINQILEYIQDGANECGGGTDLREACIPQIVATTYQYKNRNKTDDVHIIITDGETGRDQCGIEQYLESSINAYKNIKSSSMARIVVKNCIWFLYDNDNSDWDDNIKEGKIVHISSKNFRPN